MMGRLTGKTALITGGTTGIGLATAKLFLKEGARVAIIGQDAQRVEAAGKELGEGVLALRADVSSASDMAGVAAKLKSVFGSLDVVFANAGIAQPMPFSDVDAKHIDNQVDVNFKGVIYTVQSVLSMLNNPSSVVLTGTTLVEQGVAGLAVYSATKAAVRSLARTLSTELTPRGLIETPIYGKLGLPPEAVQEWAGQLMAKVPASRFGQPDEVAKAVLFLASDDSSYMIGENILFDGGMATL
jgi:NAD(P)-dependent dehydrogenase (short-subunit alcohol dehydrogenase family)